MPLSAEAVREKEPKVVDVRQQLEYWLKQLDGSHPAEFLCDKPRQRTSVGEAKSEETKISGSLYQKVQEFGKSHHVPASAILLAAFRATHYRLAGTEDASMGFDLGEYKKKDELRRTSEIYVNLQCIRIKVEDDSSFEQLVDQINKTTVEGHAYQGIPIQNLVAELPSDAQDGPRKPVVRIALFLHSQHDQGRFTPNALKRKKLSIVADSELDLEFHLFEESNCFHGVVLFATELYHEQTIIRMLAVFNEILKGALEEPQKPIACLSLSDGISTLRDMGLLDIQRTAYGRELSVVESFQRQVNTFPDSVAVKDFSGELTYARLDKDSDCVAYWLTKTGFAAESLIGVLAARSCLTVVAFLGILKSNMAYVPLDTKAPKSRIQAIVSAASGCKVILLGANIPIPDIQLPNVQFIFIAKMLSQEVPKEIGTVAVSPSATSLAYVMFTSGSTGKPKGVMIEHRGIVRMADTLSPIWGGAPVAQMANIAFDTSTSEIYTPLLTGGTVVCIDDRAVLDVVKLCETFKKEKVEVAVFTPAFLKECFLASPATVEALRILFIAGDRVNAHDAFRALGMAKEGVYNSYGPTENSVLSTFYRIVPEEKCVNGMPIGRAITNSGAYVMDLQQRLVPVGVLGELVVTGDGIARGYTDPERDFGRFVNVIIDGKSVRAYRTGDLVRYRAIDGQLEFFGRMDYQVKIRGHRVELPEVEHTLLSYKSVSDAVTVIRKAHGYDAELVSFVTISDGEDSSNWDSVDWKNCEDHVDTWREHFDMTAYAGIDGMDSKDLGRDFVGWTSMYDGTELDRDEMQEWLEDTISTILDGGEPRNVLEVGTGSGMILFNLPTSLESYVGLELAEKAAMFVTKAAQSIPLLQGKVKVRIGTATDTACMDRLNAPDLVVINSTLQYFPDLQYLMKTIETLLMLDSVELLFLGDVRSYALYREFQVTKSLRNMRSTATPDMVRQKMGAIENTEEELLIDPAFFTSLKDRLPDLVEHVEILPKRMKATNELSCYRYAAVIHCRGQKGSRDAKPLIKIDEKQWIDFVSHKLDRQSLLQLLEDENSSIVAISNIPHSKTILERCVLEILDAKLDEDCAENNSVQSDASVMASSRQSLSAVDLHEIANLAKFRVEVSWARQNSQHGGFDAVFHRYEPKNPESRVLFCFPTDDHGRDFHSFTNQPLRQQWKRKVEEQLRLTLKTKLPSYMVPSIIRVLDKMPINGNGKVDRRALEKSAQLDKIDKSSTYHVAPRNNVERILCEEFASVLGEEVGISDSFQDLGGHSLQAARLVSRINSRLKCKLYVFDLLNSPTPAALGGLISSRSTKEFSGEPTWHSELHRRTQSQATVVLIHGLWGQGSIFTPLVPLLDDLFNVLAIDDPFFGQADGPRTIRQWAALYLDHVEKQTPPGHKLIFAGYSLGGLIAYEMASLWRVRHGQYPASLLLLDAATYKPLNDDESEHEIEYALTVFGESQRKMILDHFNKVAPLALEPSNLAEYHGNCLCVMTPEPAKAGALDWWKAKCPALQQKLVDSSHHALLSDSRINMMGRLVNEHCCQFTGKRH